MFWRRQRNRACCKSCCCESRCCESCCCRTCCRCESCCCCSCRRHSEDRRQEGPAIETRIFVERVLDVPMTTYYGPGYTELDCCVDTRNVLQEISDTLREERRPAHSGGRARCCR